MNELQKLLWFILNKSIFKKVSRFTNAMSLKNVFCKPHSGNIPSLILQQ